MTDEEVRELPNGVYLITWDDDAVFARNVTVAAVGRNIAGAVWLASAHWSANIPIYSWEYVRSATLLAHQNGTYATELTGMLLAALRTPNDDTVLRALQDCISERIGPPALMTEEKS